MQPFTSFTAETSSKLYQLFYFMFISVETTALIVTNQKDLELDMLRLSLGVTRMKRIRNEYIKGIQKDSSG